MILQSYCQQHLVFTMAVAAVAALLPPDCKSIVEEKLLPSPTPNTYTRFLTLHYCCIVCYKSNHELENNRTSIWGKMWLLTVHRVMLQ